jgi:hypothetical protein
MTGNSSHQGYFRATYPQQPQWNTSQQTRQQQRSCNTKQSIQDTVPIKKEKEIEKTRTKTRKEIHKTQR